MALRRQAAPVLIKADGTVQKLQRVPLGEHGLAEENLQELLRQHPEVLPVEEIEPPFAPLVCIGREVPAGSGSIDNLYLSAQGYPVIVETKLWRNPEARREVVTQILEYTAAVVQWSFEDLEERVKAYNARYYGKPAGILDTLQRFGPIDESDVSLVGDTVARNLREGKMLLLIVGDGIHETVEELAHLLDRYPGLRFTLALIEIQISALDTDGGRMLFLVPEVVARTREIPRAVVYVESDRSGRAVIWIGAPPETKKGPRPRPMTREAFFEALSRLCSPPEKQLTEQLIEDVEAMGCKVEGASASLGVKVPDSGGSGRLFSLFNVYTDGSIATYSGWPADQLGNVGLPSEIGYKWVERAFVSLLGKHPPSGEREARWNPSTSLRELRNHYQEFLSVVKETIEAIRRASADDLHP